MKKKKPFLIVRFVHINGLSIVALTLKVFDKNNWCLLIMVKTKTWLKNIYGEQLVLRLIFCHRWGVIVSRMCIGIYNIVKLK